MDDAGVTARRGPRGTGVATHLESALIDGAPAPLAWGVRPGRGRPRAARLGLALWLAVTAVWILAGPRGFVLLLLVLGIYLLGPLWVPVTYRVDDDGLLRATPFGRRLFTWEELGSYEVVKAERAAYIQLRGRGTARLLPPVLLLWESGAGEDFTARLEAALAYRLGEGERERA